MKNNILKVFVLFVFFCVITPAFALPPSGPAAGGETPFDDPSGNCVECDSYAEQSAAGIAEGPEDPIDSKMYLLAGAGVLVAGYFFNRNKLVKA